MFAAGKKLANHVSSYPIIGPSIIPSALRKFYSPVQSICINVRKPRYFQKHKYILTQTYDLSQTSVQLRKLVIRVWFYLRLTEVLSSVPALFLFFVLSGCNH